MKYTVKANPKGATVIQSGIEAKGPEDALAKALAAPNNWRQNATSTVGNWDFEVVAE